jgi:hypothetical protein
MKNPKNSKRKWKFSKRTKIYNNQKGSQNNTWKSKELPQNIWGNLRKKRKLEEPQVKAKNNGALTNENEKKMKIEKAYLCKYV